MQKEIFNVVKEKVSSKEEFLSNSIRYSCDVCGKTVTSLEVFDENDIVLCPQCAFFASYDDESQRPQKPFWLTSKSVKNLYQTDLSINS